MRLPKPFVRSLLPLLGGACYALGASTALYGSEPVLSALGDPQTLGTSRVAPQAGVDDAMRTSSSRAGSSGPPADARGEHASPDLAARVARDQAVRPRMDPLICSFVPGIVAKGHIRLPVDDVQEAQAIAAAWLDAVGDPTLRLGEMRRLDRAFLLTVVDRSDEQMLRHRIVIGVHDGRVAVL